MKLNRLSNTFLSLTLFFSLTMLIGCQENGETGDHADTDQTGAEGDVKDPMTPDLTGTLTRIDPGIPDKLIMVEEDPESAGGSAKGLVKVVDETEILGGEGENPSRLTKEDLKEGMLLKVWFEGPVAESYPVQGTGGKIVVMGNGAGTTPTGGDASSDEVAADDSATN